MKRLCILILTFIIVGCSKTQPADNKNLKPFEDIQNQQIISSINEEPPNYKFEADFFTKNKDIQDERVLFRYARSYGYLDKSLNVIIDPQYKEASVFKNGYAIVTNNDNKTFLINTSGELLYSFGTYAFQLWNELFSYKNEENLYVIENILNNKVLAQNLRRQPLSLGENRILVSFTESDDLYNYIDFNGTILYKNLTLTGGFPVSPKPFSEQRATVVLGNNWDLEVIDINGNIISRTDLKMIGNNYSEGLIAIKDANDITGFMDINGDISFEIPFVSETKSSGMIPPIPQATDFVQGHSIVMTNLTPTTWKVINYKGEVVSDEIYVQTAEKFIEGLSRVSLISENGGILWGYIDTSGKFVIEPVFSAATAFKNEYAQVIYQGFEGIVDKGGNLYLSKDIVKGSIQTTDLKSL